MWQMSKENGIMESECIIVLFVSFLEKKKHSYKLCSIHNLSRHSGKE